MRLDLIKKTSVTVALIITCVSSGCRSTGEPETPEAVISIPEWISRPQLEHRSFVPVNIKMRPPAHIVKLANKYELPGWLVYGVMRSMGSREMVIDGSYRILKVTGENGYVTSTADNITYEVSIAGIDAVLNSMAAKYVVAESESRRMEILASHVHKQFGSYVLFALEPGKEADLDDQPPPMERFSTKDDAIEFSEWEAGPDRYTCTVSSDILNNDLFDSFRKAEEDAIYTAAKNLVNKAAQGHSTSVADDEVRLEIIKVRVQDLRVIRRRVDLNSRTCMVTIEIPAKGVTIL